MGLADGKGVPRSAEFLELSASRRVTLDPFLQRIRVARHRGSEALVGAECDRERRGPDNDPAERSRRSCVSLDEPHARREPLASDRDREHGQRGADRVRPGDEHDPEAHLAASGECRHGGEHGARTGYEHEADADADEKSVRVAGDLATGEKEERTLEQPRDAAREQARRRARAVPRSRCPAGGPRAGRER